jgi:hypothetical protein
MLGLAAKAALAFRGYTFLPHHIGTGMIRPCRAAALIP